MENKNEKIDAIVNLEWEMFSAVNNSGGKAPCQNRPDTFYIMRSSQFETWPLEILNSYYEDVTCAKNSGRNLCTEKYGYMMEFTVPDEFAKIKDFLPAVSSELIPTIRQIVDINLQWEEESAKNYPHMRSNGRPLRKEEDSLNFVSVETYLFCELKTYSEKTINLLYDYTKECKDRGINLSEKILENTALAYGYKSLSQAEETLANQTRY